jgi:hypothetical protein
MTASDDLRLLSLGEAARRWVTVPEFARYLGISSVHAYRLVARDPDVRRVTRRFGRRVMVCLWAWREGEERRMADDAGAPLPRIVPQNRGRGVPG